MLFLEVRMSQSSGKKKKKPTHVKRVKTSHLVFRCILTEFMTNIPTHHSADYPKKKKKKTYLHNTATHFEYKLRKESAAARESKCIFLVKT